MATNSAFWFPIEQTFIVGLTNAICLAPSDLTTAAEDFPELEGFPLYAIARRPRLSIVEVGGEAQSLYVVVRNPDGDEVVLTFENFDAELSVEDGGLFFEIQDGTGQRLEYGRAAQLLTLNGSPTQLQGRHERAEEPLFDESMLDLEVLYIGKSDDEKGATERRLLSHSRLQQVLADHIDHAPDYELWVIPMQFGAKNTVSILHGQESERELDLDAVLARVNPPFERATLIALAEAAAIRLFDPHYNKHYRGSFPSLTHQSYSEVFPSEFNGLGIIIDTFNSIRCRLWSEARPADFAHEAAWPIDPTNRKSLSTAEDILALFADANAGAAPEADARRQQVSFDS